MSIPTPLRTPPTAARAPPRSYNPYGVLSPYAPPASAASSVYSRATDAATPHTGGWLAELENVPTAADSVFARQQMVPVTTEERLKAQRLLRMRQRKWWKGHTWWQWMTAIGIVTLIVGGAVALVCGPVYATVG